MMEFGPWLPGEKNSSVSEQRNSGDVGPTRDVERAAGGRNAPVTVNVPVEGS